jgi:hypothetical protein
MVLNTTSNGIVTPSSIQAISSVVLTLVTIAYAYLTYRVVGETKRQAEELRRERKRPFIFDIIIRGIEPIKSQLEKHKLDNSNESNRRAPQTVLPKPPSSIDIPPEPVWSDLSSDHSKLVELFFETVDKREKYDDEWKSILMI